MIALAFQPAPEMLRAVFEEALARSASTYGETDARTAQAARDLGLFLVRQGELPAAREALGRAVRADEKIFGLAARQTLADLAELASLSDPARAEPMWARASASPDPAIVARAFSALGDLRKQAGNREEAIALYRKALEKEEISTGKDSVRVAARLNTLALVVDSGEDIALLERALRISTARVGLRRVET